MSDFEQADESWLELFELELPYNTANEELASRLMSELEDCRSSVLGEDCVSSEVVDP